MIGDNFQVNPTPIDRSRCCFDTPSVRQKSKTIGLGKVLGELLHHLRLSHSLAFFENARHFQFSLGPPDSGFSLFLAERTKKVHFIRHAEGHHNVLTAETGSNTCLHRGAYEFVPWPDKLILPGVYGLFHIQKVFHHPLFQNK
jgi:hypothetical protein